MPWTYDDPPDVAKNWTDTEIMRCVDAANAVLQAGGTDEEAIYACIHAAGKGRRGRRMNDKRELILVPAACLEVRSETTERPTIAGYAAVFNHWADIGGFREQIAPGAFTKTLQEADVRALVNHDANYVLGRTKSGTLRLWEDEHGLAFEVDPPEAQWAQDLMASIRRGDVDQMSFGFRAIKDRWEGDERTLLEVALYDVSVVTFPAYAETEAHLRSMGWELYIPEPPQAGHSDGDTAEGSQEGGEPAQGGHSAARVRLRRRRLELEWMNMEEI